MRLWWLVAGDWSTALGIATIYTLRRFYILMRCTTISHFSFLIQAMLSNVIKGQHAHEPRKY